MSYQQEKIINHHIQKIVYVVVVINIVRYVKNNKVINRKIKLINNIYKDF
jgi:hypothetical protein